MDQSIDPRIACIFLTQQDFVKGLAMKYAPWPGIVDDVVQQVFLEFVSKKDQWKVDADVRPLLATMTRHVARRFWREKLRNMPDALRELAQRLESPETDADFDERHEEKKQALNVCMEQLSTKNRQLIDMRYFGQMKPAEISRIVQVNAKTVYQSLYRLRAWLHDCITKRIDEGRVS